MQFMITAYDGKDDGALERRMVAREEHLKLVDKLFKEGKYLYGVALLDENDKMIGSCVVVDFPTRKDVDQYLELEPYVKGNVWKEINVMPCKVAPTFMELYK
ncbi:YciI family protein [Alkaliphilus transvaalensis]|uniref:YciI family protein n=1 Tax=Alkaliphilus transvaalensis TaxID=114628 RepID=UPI0004795D53|nr:YciI family protein [Alkaliphilus transvaalensis]